MRAAKAPCSECPWRLDQPVGRFAAERYEALRSTSAGPRGESAPLGAPLFACHKTAEGREIACAGWLAVEGCGHVRVRLAVAQGDLCQTVLEPGEGWPPLYGSFDELARANGADPSA